MVKRSASNDVSYPNAKKCSQFLKDVNKRQQKASDESDSSKDEEEDESMTEKSCSKVLSTYIIYFLPSHNIITFQKCNTFIFIFELLSSQRSVRSTLKPLQRPSLPLPPCPPSLPRPSLSRPLCPPS